MLKPFLLLSLTLLGQGLGWAQSLWVHSGTSRDSIAISDLDSIVFKDIVADDATLLAYTKPGNKNWKTRSVDSVKVKPSTVVVPPDTGRVIPGAKWMFIGDSQTAGRATGETKSHHSAFATIWNANFSPAVTDTFSDGQSGGYLIEHMDRYDSERRRTDRTWVHFQESGGQTSSSRNTGQATAADFGATWESFVRMIKAQSPAAVISTETAFSFGRESEAGRNWNPYNVALREKLAALAKEGIQVKLAEVDRNIKDLGAAVGAGNVWFQSNETDAYHYKNLGNLMVALSIFDAFGYDVNKLDMSKITTVAADQKTKCLEIINKY
jgi:hypothetical protein